MKIVNLTVVDANAFIKEHHRHSKPVRGHKFSIGAVDDNMNLIGVCVIGRPVARKLDDGVTAEITRLCVLDDAPNNACSFLYRSAWRAWSAMGGERIITYILESEEGFSLKGAGFKCVAKSPKWQEGKGWTTRENRAWQQVHAEGKTRWELIK